MTRRAAHDDSEHGRDDNKTTTTMPNHAEQANYFDGDRPAPAWSRRRTFKQGARSSADRGAEAAGLQKQDPAPVPASLGLVLSNEAVTEAERKREASGGRVDAHPVSRAL